MHYPQFLKIFYKLNKLYNQHQKKNREYLLVYIFTNILAFIGKMKQKRKEKKKKQKKKK